LRFHEVFYSLDIAGKCPDAETLKSLPQIFVSLKSCLEVAFKKIHKNNTPHKNQKITSVVTPAKYSYFVTSSQ